ncbi:hypothetical protein BGZ95_005028 [Linnemannia exigua]|uniref:MD-2-related lipid-recognition domain-containing protein n=1 Tax=Linnemannia exigua TaxID=604196 RepID=A0AAD4DH08_9FUNG|nr:hypothetical protein BGZ95_005028 [Linnemannia exigua]
MNLTVVIAVLASVILSTVSAQVPSYTNFTKCYDNSVDQYCISVTGNSQVPITRGATVNQGIVIAGKIWPPSPGTDLCQLLAESGNPCPIPSGPISLKVCFNSPTYLPQDLNPRLNESQKPPRTPMASLVSMPETAPSPLKASLFA